MSLFLNFVLGAIIAGYGLVKLASALIAKPEGRHAAARSFQVRADIDQQVVPAKATLSQPPPEFFEDDPDWVETAKNWHASSSSIRALFEGAADASYQARRCSQILAELQEMYNAA